MNGLHLGKVMLCENVTLASSQHPEIHMLVLTDGSHQLEQLEDVNFIASLSP